ncbi:MAG: right-handed parallel beta-helix repeat-containing protein, partial [Actinomycetota bacterium]
MARKSWIMGAALALAALAIPAAAHVERPTEFPPGLGSVPTYRTTGPLLLVCKGKKTANAIEELPKGLERRNERWHERCQDRGYHNLQAAIDHVVEQGSRIKILPGIYRELPTSGPVGPDCAGLETQRPLSYEEQVRCPHVDNLVTILGDSA